MRLRHASVLALASLLLAACAAAPRPYAPETAPWIPRDRPAPSSDSDSLLLYYDYVRRLKVDALDRERAAARSVNGRSPSEFNRIRYALALSAAPSGSREQALALGLLDPIAHSRRSPLAPLATLLAAAIGEHRHAADLQSKIDALKSLEQTMTSREKVVQP